jgi:hypothetical protein
MGIRTCSMDYDEGACLNAVEMRVRFSNDENKEWHEVCGDCATRQRDMITATTGLDKKKQSPMDPECDGCGARATLDQRVDLPATRDGRAPMLCSKCQGRTPKQKTAPTVWVVTMPGHYEWVAVGRTKQEALDGLRKAWNRHSPEKWLTFYNSHGRSTPADYFGAHFHEMKMGEGEQY